MARAVDLGPRAEQDPLAREIRRRVDRNLGLGHGLRAFRRMWGTVVIVRRTSTPPDRLVAGTDAPLRELTLRFDYGHLVIHGGRVGRPDVTLWGTDEQILSVGEAAQQLAGRVGAGGLASGLRRLAAFKVAVWGPNAGSESDSRLSIFGRSSHPRFVYRLALVLDTSG